MDVLFLGYIHSFRALAIFFIVAGHCIDAFVWDGAEDVEKLLRIVISNGSVLFVFIAGYLFQHLSHKFETKKYYKSKLKNVITPYILISIPAIAIFVTIMQRDTVWAGFYDNSVVEQVFWFYITGKHLAPLWFVPMITIFYLIGPLLVHADSKKVFYYSLPLFIGLSCLVSRGYPHQSFIHFLSVYLMGMFCSKYKEQVNLFLQKWLVLAVGLFAILGLVYYEFFIAQGATSYINYTQKMIMALFFLGLLVRLSTRLDYKFIGVIADTSFGVFFIHSYILTGSKLLFAKLNGSVPVGNMFLYITSAVVFLLISMSLILMAQKIFGKRSRLLVGS